MSRHKTSTCKCCNGTGKVELIDLGDGIFRSPENAKARIEADNRILALSNERMSKEYNIGISDETT